MMRLFSIYDFQVGDVVQLRFTGDRGVPARLGGSWAEVTYLPWAGQWRNVAPVRVPVEAYGEPDVERRVKVDQITSVERRGETIARRHQTPSGTSLYLEHESTPFAGR
jgi:hypothetical protein